MATVNYTATTPEDVRKHLDMFSNVISTVVKWIPGEVGTKAKKLADLIVTIFAQDWFVGLIVYLINTFSDTPLDREIVGAALEHYALALKENKSTPVKFDLE